jgi:gluconate 2-dehydrogenase gamma chain
VESQDWEKSTDELIHRRDFLVIAVGGSVSGLLLSSCSGPGSLSPWRFFTRAEGLLVEALADQIIPPDQDPGGRWAQVAHYIDRQLISYYRHLQERYRDGIASIEGSSVAIKGSSFTDLSLEDRKQVLEAIEQNEVPDGVWEHEPAASFFNLLLDHCMQGYYGTPRHGGNRDYVSYRMIGLDYPQILGRVKNA